MKKSILSALAALSLSAPVLAADYYVVVPLPGKVAASEPEAPDPVENITVTLNAYALPAGMVNTPYSFDLNAVLDVQGDAAYDAADVAWSVVDGATPEGIALQADGTLAGTPTVKNEAGASFEVKASYKGQDGKQVYTIVVGKQVLQVTQIASGGYHTCALTISGGVKCWGNTTHGQLGDGGSTTSKNTPVDVIGLTSGVASVTAGYAHTCVVTTSGGMQCWGNDDFGQLGDGGSNTNQPAPVNVSGLTSGVASATAGGHHTCAVTTTGGLKCWGAGSYGQLGNDGTTTRQTVPTNVTALASGVVSVTAGYYHTCAVTTAGGAKCWGHDGLGQLGDGGSNTDKTTPVNVSGLTSGVASVTAGYYHTCALTAAGGVKCWGADSDGQLGDGGTNTDKGTPVNVSGLSSGVANVTAGWFYSCALTTSGGVQCWGVDAHGQLGNDTANVPYPTPVNVAGLTSGVASIEAGGAHTCVLALDGGMKCWGFNGFGQLGDGGANANQPTPVDVAP